MSKISFYVKKALSIPPRKLVKKLAKTINKRFSDRKQRKRDLTNSTHINFDVPLIKHSYLSIDDLDTSTIQNDVTIYLSKMYHQHRFDLLGSGWVKNSYNSSPLGVEGHKYHMNTPSPKSIHPDYEPIDWQKDYKSGYRWDTNKWYKDQRNNYKIGTDIKVPWELSRLQHLPQLAVFSLVNKNLTHQNIQEFKYQVLDFIKHNPPRMGVNWVCTMDVGIRVANMLIAFDLFTQVDREGFLDNGFKQTFANSVYEHGLHILNNLEYTKELTSNHYLSNIAGLLFVASYLECNAETNSWLAFSIQEIISEMQREFYEDGGNFESSTSYHRLSGELMIYSTALILGLKEDKIRALQNYNIQKWRIKPRLLPLEKQLFKIQSPTKCISLPQWFIDRLYKAGRLTVDVTNSFGEIVQIGDNDSGRFFRLSPNGQFLRNKEAEKKYLNLEGYYKQIESYSSENEKFWDENILNHQSFISAISGLFEDEIFITTVNLEKTFIGSLANSKLTVKNKSYKKPKTLSGSINSLRYNNKKFYNTKTDIQNLKLITYPDSGLYVFKADNLHLTLCATPLGQKGKGGHTHNDKLSYELSLEEIHLERSPGTYLYTPLPHRRNEFRSVKAHNTLITKEEQNTISRNRLGLFSLDNESACEVVKLKENCISIKLTYRNTIQTRTIQILERQILISDSSNVPFSYSQFLYHSNGYGKLTLSPAR